MQFIIARRASNVDAFRAIANHCDCDLRKKNRVSFTDDSLGRTIPGNSFPEGPSPISRIGEKNEQPRRPRGDEPSECNIADEIIVQIERDRAMESVGRKGTTNFLLIRLTCNALRSAPATCNILTL
jgi:hypothetical protein